jgi:hypothetical protein
MQHKKVAQQKRCQFGLALSLQKHPYTVVDQRCTTLPEKTKYEPSATVIPWQISMHTEDLPRKNAIKPSTH